MNKVPASLSRLYPPRRAPLLEQWRAIIRNIKTYSFFIYQLVRISFIGQFKRSFFGLLWLFVLPIIAVIAWVLLHGAGIVEPGATNIPYPAFVLLSTSIWGFFSDMSKSSSRILSKRSNMIIMTRFPHEVLVAERVVVHVIRFIIPFLINIVVLLIFGVRFTWLSLLFPLTLVPLLLFGLALGLIVSLLRVVAFDLANLFDQAINFLMFLTPVVYAPQTKISWLSKMIHYNPLTYLIGFSRDVLTQGTFYEPKVWAICTILALVFFLFSVRVFLVAEAKMVERLINS